MKDRAQLANHPIHPMLVTLPIGAFVFSLVFDIVYLFSGNPFWYAMAFWLIVAGVITGLLAAVPGLLDYLTSMPNERARRTAARHGILNGSIVVLYIINAIVRATGSIVGGRLGFAVFLSLLGVAGLVVSGWLGGELVYVHRVGVSEPPEAVAPGEVPEEHRAA